MSLQPRTAAPGKARRAASAGKPRTKKNAAKSTKSTFNPIDKEVRTESRSVKKEAPKTTRRYSDGPKGTPTRKEERNLERSKLRAKRYQEKIAPKAKTTSRADEFVAKRTERAERPERAARPEKTERTFKKTEYRSGEYKKTTFTKSDTRPTTRREAAKADPANDGRPNFVPQKRTKWIPGQKPRKPETERPDTTRANRTERAFKPRSTTDSRTVNKTYSGKKASTAHARTHTREAVDFGVNDNYITEDVIETKSRNTTSASATLTDTDVTWTQLGISAPLVNALSAQGITSPFPIQIATLPDALKGHDILGRGQTGSGKTLAFGLALLNNLQNKQAKPHKPLALVLTPTRELAQQIDEVLTPLARAIGHESVVIAGGMPYAKQITAMRKATAILVATPGRLIDLLNRGEVQLDNLEITVLDEADQMADMGFLPVVKEILDQGKMGGQRLLFSATLDRGVDSLVKSYLKNPKTHSLQNDRASVSTMEHHVLVMHPGDKDLITAQIAARNGKTILFVKTQRGADRLADNLAKAGVPVGALHGGKSQAVRTRTLKLFKEQDNAALVATDVAARGIHVDGISLVVHVDAPTDHKDYLHRSGRTARAGEAGGVVVLATTKQQTSVKGLTSRAGVTPKFVGVKPNDAELMTITGAQEPSGIPYVAPIVENRGPSRSGGKRPRPNSSQRRRRPR
jgi:superfamily II DNA/RNA helicase